MKKGLTTVVEITDAHIKLLQCRNSGGKVVIQSCRIHGFANRTDEEVANVLSQLLKDKSLKKQELIFIVPRRLIILKLFKLPSSDAHEIAKMVPLQLVNKIPYSLKDVVYDYDIVDKNKEGYSNVLVSVIHKDVSNRYIALLKSADMHFSRLTVSSEGLVGWSIYQQSKKKLNAKEAVGIINIDSAHVEICFCYKHHLMFSRSLKYGAKDLNGEYTKDLMQQIKVSFESYHKEEIGPVLSRAIVISNLTEASSFATELAKMINIPVDIRMPLDEMTSQKNSGIAELRTHPGLSLAATVGVLTTDHRVKGINLTPKEIHETKALQSKKKELVLFFVLMIILGALALSILGVEFLKKTKDLDDIEQQVLALDSKVVKSERMIELVDVFDQEFTGRILISDLMTEIYSVTPDGITFRSLFLDENGIFTINGYAEESASVNDFQNSLVGSDVFNEVTLQYATKRKIFNMDITDFKIIAQLVQKQRDN